MLVQVFSTMSSAATSAGTKLTHVHKKVNISDTHVAWEHEQFSRKRILSGTISRYRLPLGLETLNLGPLHPGHTSKQIP